MIFRILGTIFIIAGALIALFSLIVSLIFRRTEMLLFIAFYSLPFLVFGGIFFGESRRLAKLICFDFDKSDEQK